VTKHPAVAASASASVTAEHCTWRISAVTKVVNKTCVNDKIMNHVIATNSSCFNALPDPTNRSTDGFINCFFSTLLGNKTSGQPGIAPTLSQVATEVGELFEEGFKPVAEGGCPWSGSESADHQGIDHSRVSSGVKTEVLFVVDSSKAEPPLALTNRNAADAAGLRWQLHRQRLYQAKQQRQSPQPNSEPHEYWFDLALSELRITQVTVEFNTLFGQYSLCRDGVCNATWDCFCQSHWGDHKGPFCEGQSGDPDDDCACLLMGGCTPTLFGGTTKARFVGHKLTGEVARGGGGGGNATGHLYSFQQGGECDGKKSLCSWVKTSGAAQEQVAPAECVATLVLDRGVSVAVAVEHCANDRVQPTEYTERAN
jgi:hypothetical protein